MNDFHFLRPTLLWLLIIPLVYLIGRLFIQYKRNHIRYIVPEMIPYLTNASNGYKELLFRLLPALGLAVGIVALAAPVWEKTVVKLPQQQSLSIVINLPGNCSTNDVVQMKVATYHLLDSLETQNVSLSVQSGSAHLLIPYTKDYRLIRTYVEFISPEIMPLRGDHLEEIVRVTTPPSTTSFHSVVYVTPMMSEDKAELWKKTVLQADYKVALTTQRSLVTDSVNFIFADADNKGIGTLMCSVKKKADEKMQEKALKDSTQWKDRGYLLCIPATLLLLPLFFRYKKSLFLIIGLCFSSCSYTHQMWNEAQVNLALMKEDTLEAIRLSDDPFRKGMLWVEQKEYQKAAQEFAKDTTCEALYNRGQSIYRNGYFVEALSLLREVENKRPEWEFVSADIKVIENLIASGITNSSSQKKWSEESDSDRFEQDRDKEKNGHETELWADKLVNETPENMNYSKDKSPKQSEVLFRQIENNPKEFIKRRLQYEYMHKE